MSDKKRQPSATTRRIRLMVKIERIKERKAGIVLMAERTANEYKQRIAKVNEELDEAQTALRDLMDDGGSQGRIENPAIAEAEEESHRDLG